MRGTADRVAGAEQAVDGHHAVVAPLVFRRGIVRGPARPGAGAGRVRAHDVGLGRGQLGIGELRVDVLRGPHHRLTDRHAEEILPADRLLVRILEGLRRDHADRAAAGLDLLEQGVVAQTGRHRMAVDVVADQLLGVIVPLRLVFLAEAVLGVGLEMQEVGADRAVSVLEPRQDDPVLHLGHLRAGEDRQRIGRCAAPRRVPGPPHAFTDRARLEDVRCAAGAHDDGFRAKHVEVAGADIEAHGACDPIAVSWRPSAGGSP